MKNSALTFWNRCIEVWKPSFVAKLMVEKNEGRTWGFWFLSNAVLALLVVVFGYFYVQQWLGDFPDNVLREMDEIMVQLPDKSQQRLSEIFETGEVEIISGNLFTKNIPDPSIVVFNETTAQIEFHDSRENILGADIVAVIDSAEEKFDPSMVDDFEQGIFLFSEQAFIKQPKDENGVSKLQEIDYFDMGIGGILNKNTAMKFVQKAKQNLPPVLMMVVFVVLYLFLSVIRLMSAVFWALIFWAIGSIIGIKNWSFEWSFMSVLHFKFITLVFFSVIFITDLFFSGAVLLVFMLLFGMNFWQIKQAAKD